MPETIGTAYVQIEPSAKGIGDKLNNVISPEAEKSGEKAGGTFTKGFGKVMGTAGKIATAAVAAGTTAATALVTTAVNGYAEYEQLAGGIETLFGDSAEKAMNNASNAFKTAGMSANEYMETSISMAAAMINSLDGDTEQAASMVDLAITDMSDNVNKMGTTMESVQNAYVGFSRGNYTMLDNLALGFAGTKEGMQSLLDKATELSGVEYDISSYSDIVQAIHEVQTSMDITGTTSKEAASTIQGSLASLGASWQNVLTGMGTEGANMDALINNLVENAQTFINNLIPVIETALSGLSGLITQLAPVIATEIPKLITECLPGLLEAGVQVIEALGQGILEALPALMPTIVNVILQLADMIIKNLPEIIQCGLEIIYQLSMGIAEALPTLIPTIVDVIIQITETLIENVDLLIDGSIALIVGLAEGLINALPRLIEKIPEIIIKIGEAIITNTPKLITAAIEIILTIQKGIIDAIPKLIEAIPKVLDALKNAFINGLEMMVDVGANIVNGIKKGISQAWEGLISWVGKLCSKLVGGTEKSLQIGSPSKVFADEVGRWIPAGIAVGIEANADSALNAVDELSNEMAMSSQISNMGTDYTGTTYATQPSADNGLYELLSTYLPMIANGQNITLEGDAGQLFKMVRSQNDIYKNAHNRSAFA